MSSFFSIFSAVITGLGNTNPRGVSRLGGLIVPFIIESIVAAVAIESARMVSTNTGPDGWGYENNPFNLRLYFSSPLVVERSCPFGR